MTPQKISTNRYLGAPITNINQIINLITDKKAVVIQFGGYSSRILAHYVITPAAWLINRPAGFVQGLINGKQLFHCIKKEDFEILTF
jgi:hypothetical protein